MQLGSVLEQLRNVGCETQAWLSKQRSQRRPNLRAHQQREDISKYQGFDALRSNTLSVRFRFVIMRAGADARSRSAQSTYDTSEATYSVGNGVVGR